MTAAHYVTLFKTIGKLAYLYDSAAAGVTALQLAAAALMEQLPDGGIATAWPRTKIIAEYATRIDLAITSGPVAVKQAALDAAYAFLRSSEVIAFFVLTPLPTSQSTAAAIVTALQAEMAEDTKTLTTVAATGIVNFLNQLVPTSTWTTEADATADYSDTTMNYATATQVAD